MIGFDSLIAQERPVRQLKSALVGKRLPNAFLFYGDPGVGKKSAARAVAMACNCSELVANLGHVAKGTRKEPLFCQPCGECRSCKKIISGSHPDIYLVEPSGNHIRIDQIRSLCARIALKPNEALVRVVLSRLRIA
ncbi:MAG: hypothetical protein GXP53_10100 [Deltaproteobacteria bacterium]|nr:hypothetical protein [Deltaproteobacteria bacterium]